MNLNKIIIWSISILNKWHLKRIEKYDLEIPNNEDNYEALIPNTKDKKKTFYGNPFTVALKTPNVNNIAQSVGFVGANSDAAITALTSKLLHYGKYGYLGFEGDGAKNVMKGSLPALDSPLSVKVNDGEVTAKLTPRKALYQSKRGSGRPKH